jgi:peroxiredoxin
LESYREQFSAIGVAIAGMTYDSQEVLKAFSEKEALQYPLLQDQDLKHVNALGIRNEAFGEDSNMYGIPHPGVIFVDAQGAIAAKYAVAGYRQRPPFDALLTHITGLVTE